MSIRRFKRYAGGGKLASYLHGTRIGVLVEYEGDDSRGQGRRDARRGDEAGGADVGRRAAALIEKERTHGDAEGRRGRREGEGRGQAGAVAEIVAKRVEGSVRST